MKLPIAIIGLAIAASSLPSAHGQKANPASLIAVKVDSAPVIDGNANDAAWSRAKPIVTHDPLAKIDLTVRAVYTKDKIFILATFPDKTENREHKTQVWVPNQNRYRISTDREDTFVIKWNMEGHPVDLRVDAE